MSYTRYCSSGKLPTVLHKGLKKKHVTHYQQYCSDTTDATFGTYPHIKTSLLHVMFLPFNSSARSFDASTSLLERVPV